MTYFLKCSCTRWQIYRKQRRRYIFKLSMQEQKTCLFLSLKILIFNTFVFLIEICLVLGFLRTFSLKLFILVISCFPNIWQDCGLALYSKWFRVYGRTCFGIQPTFPMSENFLCKVTRWILPPHWPFYRSHNYIL